MMAALPSSISFLPLILVLDLLLLLGVSRSDQDEARKAEEEAGVNKKSGRLCKLQRIIQISKSFCGRLNEVRSQKSCVSSESKTL